jgi:hypothetical protein
MLAKLELLFKLSDAVHKQRREDSIAASAEFVVALANSNYPKVCDLVLACDQMCAIWDQPKFSAEGLGHTVRHTGY